MTKTDLDDVSEFSEFCEQHHRNLVGLLGLFCGDRDLGEEFAQETFMRAYRDWSKVQTMDAPAAWLYRVGTNLARSHFRRKLAEARAQARLEGQPATALPEQAATIELRQALIALPARMRLAIVLRYYGRFAIAEIAATMDCSESTVKNLLRRALARLRGEERTIGGRETVDAS